MSARALARMYASLLGEVDGVRLLSAERFREATTVSASGPDQVYGDESSWGLGWAAGLPWDEQARSGFGMAGAGGSWAGVDLDRWLAFAVTKNVLSMDFDALTRVGRTLLAELDRG